MSLWRDNPVWEHEVRRRSTLKAPTILAAVNLGLLAVLGGGMFALNAWALYEPRAETVRVGIAGYWWMLITVLPHAQAYLGVTTATALVVAEEHEFRTLEALRLSHLTPAQFLAGKCVTPLRYSVWILLLVPIVFGWSNYQPPPLTHWPSSAHITIGVWLAVQGPLVLVFLALCISVGLFAGARCQTRRAAVIEALIFVPLLLAAIGLISIYWFAYGGRGGYAGFLVSMLVAAGMVSAYALQAAAYGWKPTRPDPTPLLPPTGSGVRNERVE